VKAKQKSAKSSTAAATKKRYDGFTDEERDAMKQRVDEMKVATRQADGEATVRAKIAELPKADRVLAERIHAIVKANAPGLEPKLWYGMPAYAKNGKLICHFQSAQKFKTRYATLGFSDAANLDDGNVWPVAYSLTKLTAADEAKIGALLKKAIS
jgi:uncharacterized protein YdhG (YjbR/CyaY superfamily)